MVVSAKTLDALKTIGLNKYERNLWVALLSRSNSTAGELSDVSNVPRSRCYDVLETLANRGFIVIQPGKPMKYVSISPKEALERAKKKVSEEAVELCDKIDRLVKSEIIKDLEHVHKENIKTMKPEDMTGTIKGRYALHQQLGTMLKKAKKNVKLLTTESGFMEISENHGDLIKKISENGVKVNIAVPVTKQTNDAAVQMAKNANIRDISNAQVFDGALARFCIIDGEQFLLGLTDDKKTHPTQDVAVWTQSNHAAANLFEPMFNMIWDNSKPLVVK